MMCVHQRTAYYYLPATKLWVFVVASKCWETWLAGWHGVAWA